MSAGSSRRLMRSPTSFGSTAAIAHSSSIILCSLPWHRLGLASGTSHGNTQAHSLAVYDLGDKSYYTPVERPRPTVFRSRQLGVEPCLALLASLPLPEHVW